jgi:rhodanese-related sulfurtransferase
MVGGNIKMKNEIFHKINISTRMKKSITLTFVLLFVITLESCKEEILSPERFQRELAAEKGILIDVRTPAEFAEEHIDGAINVDVQNEKFITTIDSLDKNKSYFLYCRSGKRSTQAMNLMQDNGFSKLFMLKGGIIEWRLKNMPVIKKESIQSAI